MGRPARPIILMAFANPRGDLRNLKAERSGLRKLLRQNRQCEVVVLNHPTLTDIEDEFQAHRNQIAIFHYGGHADGFGHMLETDAGDPHTIDVRGFADFLASQQGLRFVFLNGCSTDQQVAEFFESGVPCVVATTREIDDELATAFALRFYAGLDSGADLEKAFAEAAGSARARAGGQARSVSFSEPVAGTMDNEFPWQIHTVAEQAGQWSLLQARAEHRGQRESGDPVSGRQLESLLKRVEEAWVHGALREGFAGRDSLRVNKQRRPDVINNPLEALVEYPPKAPEFLDPGQSICDVFDEVQTGHRLLILGQPGSGKTTCLLELTRDLVERAHQDPASPVPVVINLSSWNDPAQSFNDWLQDRLGELYTIPRRVGGNWLRDHELFLMLDGLDEVPSHLRLSNVDALHEFLNDVGAAGVVVTCRFAEYSELPEEKRLRAGAAIHLQPLTPEQILEFVDAAGPPLKFLKSLFRHHEGLLHLAQSPLMLNIMCQAYADVDESSEVAAQVDTADDYQQHLFERYIERMFRQRGRSSPPYSREQTESWLGWLAEKTLQNNSSLFLIEQMQPGWLGRIRDQAIYALLLSFSLTLLIGLAASIFWGSATAISPAAAESIQAGLAVWGVGVLLPWFLSVCLLDLWLPNFASRGDSSFARTLLQATIKFLAYAAVTLGLVSIVLPFGSKGGELLFGRLLLTGILGSVLVAALGRCTRAMMDIRPVEALGWSRVAALKGAVFGGLAGILIAGTFMLARSQPEIYVRSSQLDSVLNGFGFFFLVLFLLGLELGAIAGGLVPRVLDIKSRPNQGMLLSRRNAVLVGSLVGGVLFVSISFFCLMLDLERSGISLLACLVFAFATGVTGFICSSIFFGGLDYLKHMILKIILVRSGQIAADLPKFMEHAGQLDFVRQVGGGYLFKHRLLQEHLARRPRGQGTP